MTAREAQIVEAFRATRTFREAGITAGVSAQRVHAVVRKHGVKR